MHRRTGRSASRCLLAIAVGVGGAGCAGHQGGVAAMPARTATPVDVSVVASRAVTSAASEPTTVATTASGTSSSAAAPSSPDGSSPASAPRRAVPKPTVRQWPIPLSAARRRETRAYARRHYGVSTDTVSGPKVIVEHWTAGTTAASALATFASDAPDVELHERPGVCSQFLIGRDGTIYQLTPIRFLCRHTVGLNDVAVGIEHVGVSDGDVLSRQREMAASYRLTRWLRCRYDVAPSNIIGHSESLGSPYHHERVPRLRTQTHEDWQASSMRRYRAVIRRRGC